MRVAALLAAGRVKKKMPTSSFKGRELPSVCASYRELALALAARVPDAGVSLCDLLSRFVYPGTGPNLQTLAGNTSKREESLTDFSLISTPTLAQFVFVTIWQKRRLVLFFSHFLFCLIILMLLVLF